MTIVLVLIALCTLLWVLILRPKPPPAPPHRGSASAETWAPPPRPPPCGPGPTALCLPNLMVDVRPFGWMSAAVEKLQDGKVRIYLPRDCYDEPEMFQIEPCDLSQEAYDDLVKASESYQNPPPPAPPSPPEECCGPPEITDPVERSQRTYYIGRPPANPRTGPQDR